MGLFAAFPGVLVSTGIMKSRRPSGCPKCSSDAIKRAHREGMKERLLSLFLVYPYRCRKCGHSAQTELDGCPACRADWKAIDVSHGPGCPKNLLEEAMDTPNGALVRRCFRILNAKSIGLTITLADVTEEEFRVLELIEAERAVPGEDSPAGRSKR